MSEKERVTTTGRKDRKLGDEWLDWDGMTRPEENEIDERAGTFFVLAAWSVVILVISLGLGWYLIKPRIDQISPFLSGMIAKSALILAALILLAVALEGILLVRFRTSLFPYKWTEKLLLTLLPKSMWLGVKFGIHRDRVANSFIKAHNLMLKGHWKEVKGDTLLVLLPRCLEKEARRQVSEKINGRTAKVVTVAGGEEARKAITEFKPSITLAVACERDLISGIRDVAEKIHVFAIPNRRPEGPCKNTCLRLDVLDDALSFIAGREGKARNS